MRVQMLEFDLKKLVSYVRSRAPSQDVDDIVSEVCARYLKAQGVVNHEAWVINVARFVAVDYYRHARKHKHETLSPCGSSADFGAVDRRLDYDIPCLLDGLPAVQSEALRLRFWEGHSYREIAARLNVTVNTVGLRLRRALLSLRSSMGL